jgi:hypothetical protein
MVRGVKGKSNYGAIAVGMMFGVALEVALDNLIVNSWHDVDTRYTSTPEWSRLEGDARHGGGGVTPPRRTADRGASWALSTGDRRSPRCRSRPDSGSDSPRARSRD